MKWMTSEHAWDPDQVPLYPGCVTCVSHLLAMSRCYHVSVHATKLLVWVDEITGVRAVPMLEGHSNMVGWGKIGTLSPLGMDPSPCRKACCLDTDPSTLCFPVAGQELTSLALCSLLCEWKDNSTSFRSLGVGLHSGKTGKNWTSYGTGDASLQKWRPLEYCFLCLFVSVPIWMQWL